MVDWAVTGQMISGIGTVAGSLAIVFAAYLGRRAVDDFRHQKVTEKQIDHAEAALALAYQLKDAISQIRSPATYGHESEKSLEELVGKEWFDNLPTVKKDRFVQANVFYIRTRHHQDIFERVFTILPLVQAYFGPDIDTAFRSILKSDRSVMVYADAYARDSGDDPTFTQKIEGIIWEGGVDPEDDATTIEINKCLALIEGKLLPVIRVPERFK